MEIRGVEAKPGPGQVGAINGPQSASAGDGPAQLDADSVEISSVAQYLQTYKNLPAVRSERVAEARQAVQAGQMDSDEKLSVALDRLLDDLLGN